MTRTKESYFDYSNLKNCSKTFESVLQNVELAQSVGLQVLVGDAAEQDAIPLLLDSFLVQVEATREKRYLHIINM